MQHLSAPRMVSRMSAAAAHRRALIVGSILIFGGVFASFLVWERPGLGIGHFYYLAVACLALALGPWVGALGGLAASSLYALGVILNPAVPSAQILTAGTLLRLFTYSAIGALVGAYARSNHSLVARLHVAAERDFLTNLLNARAFEAALERRLEARHPFALALGDMDGLKRVNDEHGHTAGNDALRQLAEALVRQARHEDEVARVGGDEFALLASVAGEDDARALARRLGEGLAAQELKISFGCAVYPEDGTTALSLFRAADARLHDRKLLRRRLVPQPPLTLLRSPAQAGS
jgi:diguanylate cyclase (GGDEF)-like protein